MFQASLLISQFGQNYQHHLSVVKHTGLHNGSYSFHEQYLFSILLFAPEEDQETES